MARLVSIAQRFAGEGVTLRLVTLDDCSPRYVGWLADPEVNRYLETRWSPQDLTSVRAFVEAMLASDHSYLFAILDPEGAHVGNIKVGPIQPRHSFADVSYFVGERSAWGRGMATAAIRRATKLAFEELGLHRVQAGVYENNRGSIRALEKAGYRLEGRQRRQLRSGESWEDHLWYGLLREEWIPW